jgi:putative DNA primase/helicase
MIAGDQRLTPDEIKRYITAKLPNLKRSGKEYRGGCPRHNGKDPNFTISGETGLWICHSQCGVGGDIFSLEMDLSGSDFRGAKAEVYRIVGRIAAQRRKLVATYQYTDEVGKPLYEICRFEPGKNGREKDFLHRYPDGCGGYVWKKHPRQVLYRLIEVMANSIIFAVEGEKDCESLRDFGFVATTPAGGARAPWLDSFTTALANREVIIIPDNDPPGWERAKQIARALMGRASRILILDDIHRGGAKDISDWFLAGHSEIELIAMLEAANGA